MRSTACTSGLAVLPIAIALGLGGCCMTQPPDSRLDAALGTVVIGLPASGELGATVCSPTPLHACRASMSLHQGLRVYPTVDVEGNASCAALEASASSACAGDPNDAATLRCLAEHGVFLDRFASFGTRDESVYTPASFRIECREGYARIDVMDPI